MALGLNTGSTADFLPLAIYDARAGRFFKVERTQTSAGWSSERVEIATPSFALDIGSLEVGYVNFVQGAGPDFKMVPIGSPLPQQPSKEHKQAFRAKIAGKMLDGLREFSHSAKCVINAMDDLHGRYLASPEAVAGKIPVIKLSGTTAIITTGPQGKTTNYAPIFEIVSFVERDPELFGERTVAAPGAVTNAITKGGAARTSTSSSAPPPNHVPPPSAKSSSLNDEMPF